MPGVSPAPHFLGIGAQKAGTTWLYANLSAHPGIWMPPEKELHYFDEKVRDSKRLQLMHLRGSAVADQRWRRQLRRRMRAWRAEGRRPSRWELRYLLGRISDDWYLRLFEAGRGRVVGEITPNYMTLSREDVRHVSELAPDARIILMIRNPIERAWSGSVMAKRGVPPTEVDDSSPTALGSQRSRTLTDYVTALDRWTAFYPPQRIFIAFMEDVALEPRLILSAICSFLGVNPTGDFDRAEEVVHRGKASSMPAAVAVRLAEMYSPLSRRLSQLLGGYADFWAFCTDRMGSWAADLSEVPYPLWRTGLWEEWVAAGGSPPMGIQSGTLDQVRRSG